LIDAWVFKSGASSSTKPVPIPQKKTKNAVGVQRKLSNITDELASILPARTASNNQPAAETKGSANTSAYFTTASIAA